MEALPMAMDVRATSLRFGWLHAGLPPCASHRNRPAGWYGLVVGSCGGSRVRRAAGTRSSRPPAGDLIRRRQDHASTGASAVRRHAHVAVAVFSGQVLPASAKKSAIPWPISVFISYEFCLAISSSVILFAISPRAVLPNSKSVVLSARSSCRCVSSFSPAPGRVECTRFYIAISLTLPSHCEL
ncbi:unnamed protein product [Urochloa decumbens]|uniref:Uncharacterized protein n=1 Tax=Urochloa decumbens TaxID=240449 RepID=A0ABC9G3C3_9POAL